jgi:hypothetical protein
VSDYDDDDDGDDDDDDMRHFHVDFSSLLQCVAKMENTISLLSKTIKQIKNIKDKINKGTACSETKIPFTVQ